MNDVKTRWASVQPWMIVPAERTYFSDLLQLAESSLAKGHCKVALQRVLKLRALGRTVPEPLSAGVTATWLRLSPTQQIRMQRAAREWADMVRMAPSRTC